MYIVYELLILFLKFFFSVKNDTLESIVSSEYLKRMKRNYSKSDIAATKYYRLSCFQGVCSYC